MSFLKRLFNRIKGEFIELHNWVGDGDGSPYLVERDPDLEKIFTSLSPPIPQRLTNKNRKYWKDSSLETKRNSLAMAYLQHPDYRIREATIGLISDVRTIGTTNVLVALLADPHSSVGKTAARSLWEWYKKDNCEYPVNILRDIIRGHTSLGFSTAWNPLNRRQAIRALDLLVEEAPNANAKKAITGIIDREVLIEERIRPVSKVEVTFVEIYTKEDGGTHERYRARSREEAVSFLKSETVTKPLYYIEVETPEGIFGRDIKGMYRV